MSNLDVYCVLHFDEKQLFAHMDELGLTLDLKDFATNGYQVDEQEHPRTASKASGRKGKAIAPSEDESEEDEEQEEEDLAGAGTSQGVSADNAASVSDDDEDIPSREDELPLSGAQLTSPIADVDALVRRRNIIAPRTLFAKESVVEAAEPPPSGVRWRRDWLRKLGRAVLVLLRRLLPHPSVRTCSPPRSTIWRRGRTR